MKANMVTQPLLLVVGLIVQNALGNCIMQQKVMKEYEPQMTDVRESISNYTAKYEKSIADLKDDVDNTFTNQTMRLNDQAAELAKFIKRKTSGVWDLFKKHHCANVAKNDAKIISFGLLELCEDELDYDVYRKDLTQLRKNEVHLSNMCLKCIFHVLNAKHFKNCLANQLSGVRKDVNLAVASIESRLGLARSKYDKCVNWNVELLEKAIEAIKLKLKKCLSA